MNSSITAFYLGRVNYKAAFGLQKAIVNLLKSTPSSCPHTILLLEHYPVYTIGVRSKDPANDYSEVGIARLKQLGAEFVKTDRGGLVTYHGPGQLVAYPILNLRCQTLLGSGLRWYVGALEQAGVGLCNQFSLQASVGGRDDIGVWLQESKKVMAIGIHKSSSITYHGIAVNCTDEPLSWLHHIVPCGLVGRDVTSLTAACQRQVTVTEVVPRLFNSLVDSLFGPVGSGKTDVRIELRTELASDWGDRSDGEFEALLSNVVLDEVKSRGASGV